MTKPFIYIFLGYSDAGKDTAAEAVDAVSIKFASPGKRALEFMLHLNYGALDDKVFRQQIAPHCQGRTYLQVSIDFYHHRDLVIGADLFGEQTREVIQGTLDYGRNVALTDVRAVNELDIIRDFVEAGYPIIPVWIDGGVELSSDKHAWHLYQHLRVISAIKGYRCNNSERPPYFKDHIAQIVAEAEAEISLKIACNLHRSRL